MDKYLLRKNGTLNVQQKKLQFEIKVERCKMTSPQGMDELFWGRDHKDVNDLAKKLTLAAEVRDLNANKLSKLQS